MAENELKNIIIQTRYYKWNEALSHFFFNKSKAEKEIFLFITKEDIIETGATLRINENPEGIYENFLSAIRTGLPGTPTKKSILHQALWAHELWKTTLFSKEEAPIYLSYLILFILPLTETKTENYRHNVYYPKLRSFLKKHNLPNCPYQHQNLNWNCLWEDLESWSIIDNDTELGFFELHRFSNSNWNYVGKPLQQCIFSVNAIKKLPVFFEKSELVPNDEIGDEQFRKLVRIHGSQYLGLINSVIKTISDPNDELGQSIIRFIKKKYQLWDGASDSLNSDTEISRKGTTIAQLRTCLGIKFATGKFKHYFRLYSPIDFPEDLCFENKYICKMHGMNWSKPIKDLPFENKLEIFDALNKWKASYPPKSVRLFVEGKYFNLNDWVEIPKIKYGLKTLILAHSNISVSIKDWGNTLDKNQFFKYEKLSIIPDFVLFEVRNPQHSHPEIECLQYSNEKKLVFKNGLKLSARKWMYIMKPQIELENGSGEENLYIEYANSGETRILDKHDGEQFTWALPEDIKFNTDFYIKIPNEKIAGDEYKYQIVNYPFSENHSHEVPCRDHFGSVVESPLPKNPYAQGLRTYNIVKQRQLKYSHYFRPVESNGLYKQSQQPMFKYENDQLLKFLTMIGKCKNEHYYSAFDLIYNFIFTTEEIENQPIDLSRLKRWSLNYLDYMGHIDYEYSTKTIVINPPQLILIPTHSGRKAILIGARTQELINKLHKETVRIGFQFKISEQDPSTKVFLLPNTISIIGFSNKNSILIEEQFKTIADKCNIQFDAFNYPQCNIAELSGDLFQYENQLVPDAQFDDHGWIAKVFNHDKLRFIGLFANNIDKNYSLVEYKLNEYTFKHKLWKNNTAYNINKNWGRYLILKKYDKDVIYYDEKKEILAVPAPLPLPRLLAESMTLCSGKAPRRYLTKLGDIKTWFHLYKNIPSTFAYNNFQKIGQNKKGIIIS